MLPLVGTIYFQSLMALIAVLLIMRVIYLMRQFWLQSLSRQHSIVDQINALLPQTQCGRCGHLGCRPYAKAISLGERINKCPPGGDETITNLSLLLNEHRHSLDPAHGEVLQRAVVVIREDECIGCTKCIQACPVDAILGGPKLMHTVIESECTACDLCIEPCPVDCIDLIQLGEPELLWRAPEAGKTTLIGSNL
jgi:electron transport complex protein RnfB